MQKVELKQREKYDSNKTYSRHPIAYKEGGIHCSKVKSKISASVMGDFVSKATSKIVKGEISNLNEISKPVKLCTPITMSEVVALDNSTTHFLDQAATYTQLNDPIKRLQSVAAFIISSIHVVPNQIYTKVPLEPTHLGETLQMYKQDTGAICSVECVQFRPPICRAFIHSKDKSWKLCYKHLLAGSLDMPKMNSMTCCALGTKQFYFKEADGSETQIESENMQMVFEGILVGERLCKPLGSIQIVDKKNKLQCEVKFGFQRTGTMKQLSNMMGSLFGKKKEVVEKKPCDYFDIEIFKVSSFNKEDVGKEDYMKCSVSKGFGNYVEYMQMDGELIWKQDDYIEEWTSFEQNELLKSDISLVSLKTLIQIEDYENATKEQKTTEKQEIADAKLRKKARIQSKEKGFNVVDSKL